MLKMMIGFFKDLWTYRHQVKKQTKWMEKYINQKQYALNPSWMMSTNLKIWLSEMDATFGKRFCPCFEPSSDADLNKKMLCPCEFIEDEIAEYGTCHCALFGKKDLSKEGWKASSKRLMSEYKIPLNLSNGILDTRGKPRDSRRNLPVPDAMHQLKATLNHYPGDTLKLIVENEQEVKNLEKIAIFRGFGFEQGKSQDYYEVTLKLR
ncbi:ferredoxin-thioredoxin reductase catalytic domain-containing protein [Sulfurospirillum sp. 1612]|uniref:ferredoxin-thioredoxin reductase catalytic domain-containing protein n=1 Tax=Sulfurospirillum sp. 1612 TaxID=3094835 RepID=UPI002F94A603